MKTRILQFTSIALMAISCNEISDNQLFTPPPLPNDVLSFSTHEQFKSVTSRIASLPQQDLSAWEKENSFKSYRSVLFDAETEWETIDTPEKETVFLNKYKDILDIEEGTLVPHIKSVMYQSIVTRDGIYRTGDHFHKVVGDYIVTVKKGDFNKLTSIAIVDGKPKETGGVDVFQYTNGNRNTTAFNGKTQATCTYPGYYKEAMYYYDPSGCNSDRRAYISANPVISLFTGYGDFNGTQRYGDYRQDVVEIRVWGTRRYITCNWGSYQTQLRWRSITFTMYGHYITAYQANQTVSTIQYYTKTVSDSSSGGSVDFMTTSVPVGDVSFNEPLYTNGFKYIYAEGSSQGVGDNWAVIYCNY